MVRRALTSDAVPKTSPSFWSSNIGLLTAFAVGLTSGWLFIYTKRRVESPPLQPPNSGANELGLPDLSDVVKPTDVDVNNIEAHLKTKEGRELLSSVQAAFSARGLAPLSAELAEWFVLSIYGKEKPLSAAATQELNALVMALSKLETPVSPEQIVVPDGRVGVIVKREGQVTTVQPTVLRPGEHAVPSGSLAILIDPSPIDLPVSVLRRNPDPKGKDKREHFKVRLEPNVDSLPLLVEKFGRNYADKIVMALADTIGEELNASIVKGDMKQDAFIDAFRRQLVQECEANGLHVLHVNSEKSMEETK